MDVIDDIRVRYVEVADVDNRPSRPRRKTDGRRQCRSSSTGPTVDFNSKFIRFMPDGLRRVLSSTPYTFEHSLAISSPDDTESNTDIPDRLDTGLNGIIPIRYQVVEPELHCLGDGVVRNIYRQTDKGTSDWIHEKDNDQTCVFLGLRLLDEVDAPSVVTLTPDLLEPPSRPPRRTEKSTRRDRERAKLLKKRRTNGRSTSAPVS